MDFYSNEELQCYNIDDIVKKMKEMKKYSNIMIVNQDDNFSSVIINVDNQKSNFITKKDFTFHLPKYKKCKKEMECSICMDNVKIGQYFRELKGCNHQFHKKCIDKWFFSSKSYSCPLCRHNFYKL